MRTMFTLALISLLVIYFVALTYSGLNAGTYAGLESYSVLLLLAIVFGALAIWDKPRLGVGFLVFLNVSWVFLIILSVALLLDLFNIVSLPISKYQGTPDLGLWLFSFGLFFLLRGFHQFGFSNKKRRLFFLWAETDQSVPGNAKMVR